MLFGGRLPVVSGGYNPACRGYNLIYTVTGRNLHARMGQNVHLPVHEWTILLGIRAIKVNIVPWMFGCVFILTFGICREN